jgi:hypothetical protein
VKGSYRTAPPPSDATATRERPHPQIEDDAAEVCERADGGLSHAELAAWLEYGAALIAIATNPEGLPAQDDAMRPTANK